MYVSKISSETYIFHSGYLLSGQYIFMWARMWGSVVILRRQKGVLEQKILRNAALTGRCFNGDIFAPYAVQTEFFC